MSSPLLLIIEDDDTILLSLRVFFEGRNYTVLTAATGREGLEAAVREIPDTVILDLRLPDSYGIDILKEIKQHHPEIPVIIMSGVGELDEAVTAMKSGAEYYFQKPVSLDELSVLVDKCIGIRQMKEEAVFYRGTGHPVIGRSLHIQGLIQMINLLGSNPSTTVLILGETGTGKELVARNIHALSSRADRPFVDINCAAIPEHILESELYGYEAGAFTDAKKTKKGLFELAEGGTLFLDEVGDMPPGAQAKILRVIETKTLKRLGGTRDITVDVRVMAATNRDLVARVKNGSFREDLYYRLNVMPLQLLPLRDRPQDIPLIAGFLLEKIKKTLCRNDVGVLTADALEALGSYAWPGNVRELKNVIERATILCPGGNISGRYIILPQANGPALHEHASLVLADMERSHIRHVLNVAEGNRSKAAKLLGIARSTLNEKIRQYQLS
ncbi:MAG: sigma-54-dependent Fis family transcriptional regulator [Nitrospirae bacterium]|nr:sigma-54-dependent Fis family transcriptional regulator [Nitrospirota bacterium]